MFGYKAAVAASPNINQSFQRIRQKELKKSRTFTFLLFPLPSERCVYKVLRTLVTEFGVINNSQNMVKTQDYRIKP